MSGDRPSLLPRTAPERRLADALDDLHCVLGALESAVVAFSGGVDSAFLLRVACSVPSLRCVAVTTDSPTNTDDEVEEARALASELGVRHIVVPVDELEVPGYAENSPDRCYLCKQTLYPVCFEIARREGMGWVVDGVNADDLGDYRPGLRAAKELGVRHPLVEAQLSKADVRELSACFGLATADKPASPCLSSRFPYGTTITHERLGRVARAESALHALGLRELRVRFYGNTARVEIGAFEHGRLIDAALRREIEAGVRAAGFEIVEIAPEPLRSGSLNDVLKKPDSLNVRGTGELFPGRRDE